jgi:hypothetical protein
VAALAEALRAGSFPQLRTLNILINQAGAAGVAALGEALRSGTFPQLRMLDIRVNGGATKADLGFVASLVLQLKVED